MFLKTQKLQQFSFLQKLALIEQCSSDIQLLERVYLKKQFESPVLYRLTYLHLRSLFLTQDIFTPEVTVCAFLIKDYYSV